MFVGPTKREKEQQKHIEQLQVQLRDLKQAQQGQVDATVLGADAPDLERISKRVQVCKEEKRRRLT